MRLLLLSNSTNYATGYLDHAVGEIRDLLQQVRKIAFVPFALLDHAEYGKIVETRMAGEGIEVVTVTDDASGARAIDQAQAIFVGGGNTFRLLSRLQTSGLLGKIRKRVEGGIPYIGSSAGTVITAPTLKTTNDMPIMEPPSFEALGFVKFQINPHFIDADPASTHMGETREQRLAEFLEENDGPVLGLREGAWIRVDGEEARLGGTNGAKLFARGADPRELKTGDDLGFLMKA